MKNVVPVFMLSALLFSACADPKVIDGVEYSTYGFLNDEKRNPNIKYELSWGNVFWGLLFSETLIAPLYFFGFSIKEPVCRKQTVAGATCE